MEVTFNPDRLLALHEAQLDSYESEVAQARRDPGIRGFSMAMATHANACATTLLRAIEITCPAEIADAARVRHANAMKRVIGEPSERLQEAADAANEAATDDRLLAGGAA